MLSRVADCLYWTGRHVERAENIARIIDVNQQLMLDVPLPRSQELHKNWLPIAACLGDDAAFAARSKKSNAVAVTDFLVFSRDNPNSIVSCLCAARENARTVREQISTEMWEQLNRSYLWCVSHAASQTFERNQHDFFQRIKQISHLLQGITDTTMVHGEGWEFIQIGKYLERADKTSRVLDDKYHILNQEGKTSDMLLQWVAVLRSCSARQAYQKVYVSQVTPVKVAEFLLLSESFPRSVRFSVEKLDQSLRRLSGVSPGQFSNPAERLAGRLLAELSYGAIEDYYSVGLHQAIDDLQIKLNTIGAKIFATYIDQAVEVDSERGRIEQVPQQ